MTQAAAIEGDSLDTSKLHFIDVDGVRTRYYEDGVGEPLLLLHGGGFGPGYSLDCWSLALPGLVKDFHVFALDRLGQGQTGNPKSREAYTFDALFQHIEAFIQQLNLTGLHLVGHSRGALPVAHLAFKYPERVRTATIVDSSTLSADPGSFYTNLPRVPGGPSRESLRIEPDAQSFSTAHITNDWLDRLIENARMPKTQEAEAMMAEFGPAWFNASLSKWRQEAHRLIDASGFPVPTQVIWALNDVSAPVEVYGYPLFNRIAAKTPRCEFHMINQSGHYVFREQVEAFNRLLRSFALG